MLCHRYIAECDMDKHVADIRKLYKHKCDLMLSELDKKNAEMRQIHASGGRTFPLVHASGQHFSA